MAQERMPYIEQEEPTHRKQARGKQTEENRPAQDLAILLWVLIQKNWTQNLWDICTTVV